MLIVQPHSVKRNLTLFHPERLHLVILDQFAVVLGRVEHVHFKLVPVASHVEGQYPAKTWTSNFQHTSAQETLTAGVG